MKEQLNLIDLNFQSFGIEEKRQVLMLLDIIMKKYHENGYMINSFDPKDIYYKNGNFNYKKISKISVLNANSKDDAILSNIINLSNLAFCSMLPSYDLSRGLLNTEIISNRFDRFENVFVPMDQAYFRSILVDSFITKKLPNIPYYYDYVSNKLKNTDLSDRTNSNVISYVKATEVGKLMADKDEAAFGTTLYFICMVCATIIAFIGLIFYFLK